MTRKFLILASDTTLAGEVVVGKSWNCCLLFIECEVNYKSALEHVSIPLQKWFFKNYVISSSVENKAEHKYLNTLSVN